MYGKSPMMKKLIGKQHNLPEALKAEIEASPMTQTKFPDSPKGKTKLQKGEMKGTSVTRGNASERLVDLEDRIEFLTSDIEGGSDRKGQSQEDMKITKVKLQSELTRLKALYKKEGKI